MPPLLEHLESLLTGAGRSLDLQTFKLVDQLSGRMLGLRADTTTQVARIDAHLLNRLGVTRLCYCGPVLHTRPSAARATREPLQLGAELYGHAGFEADVEVLGLALDCLRVARVDAPSVDLADARLVKAVLSGLSIDADRLDALYGALAAKDRSELRGLTGPLPRPVRDALLALVESCGDAQVLQQAGVALQPWPIACEAVDGLRRLADRLPTSRVTFDLADIRGCTYYTGAHFAIYAMGCSAALVRGGRYDEVGAAFGRNRPAVGFSVDLKSLVGIVAPSEPQAAILAPWGEDRGLRDAIADLRAHGEVVVCVLPGHEVETSAFRCDRELREVNGQWVVQAVGCASA